MTIDTRILQLLYPTPYKAQQLAQTLQNTPSAVKPVVTQNDVLNKTITRYFIRGVSDCSQVLEIDNTQLETYKNNPRFVTTKINWKIVGNPYTSTTSYGATDLGVEDYNKKEVERVDRTFECLKHYIRDYLELWYSDGQGNRSFVRQTPILNPPFPSRIVSAAPRTNVYNVNLFPAPSVTPSITPTPTMTPTPTPTPPPTPTPTPPPTPLIITVYDLVASTFEPMVIYNSSIGVDGIIENVEPMNIVVNQPFFYTPA
jgi:hypothetical protein